MEYVINLLVLIIMQLCVTLVVSGCIKCNYISPGKCNELMEEININTNVKWSCLSCINDTLPFVNLTDEIMKLQKIYSTVQLERKSSHMRKYSSISDIIACIYCYFKYLKLLSN